MRVPGSTANDSRFQKAGTVPRLEAIAEGTKAKAEYDNAGRIFKPSEISVADYLDYWYENYVMRNLAPNTQIDYKGKIERPHQAGPGEV